MSEQELRRQLFEETSALLNGWHTGSSNRSESLVRQDGPLVELTTPSGIVGKPLVSTHEAA